MTKILLFTLSVSFVVLLMIIITAKIEQSRRDKTKGALFYNAEDGSLTLTKRIPANKKVFKLEQQYTSKSHYQPAEYVFTGATVGGITTGGIHKTGDKYVTDIVRSDKFKIKYVAVTPIDISVIKLTPELAEKAKNSPLVSQFLSGDKLVLSKLYTNSTQDVIKGMAHSEHFSMAMDMLTEHRLSTELTKAECLGVIKWLSGDSVSKNDGATVDLSDEELNIAKNGRKKKNKRVAIFVSLLIIAVLGSTVFYMQSMEKAKIKEAEAALFDSVYSEIEYGLLSDYSIRDVDEIIRNYEGTVPDEITEIANNLKKVISYTGNWVQVAGSFETSSDYFMITAHFDEEKGFYLELQVWDDILCRYGYRYDKFYLNQKGEPESISNGKSLVLSSVTAYDEIYLHEYVNGSVTNNMTIKRIG